MYGFDKNDESIFSRFKKEGIDAVVWVKNDEAMKKPRIRAFLLHLYGAFGSSDEGILHQRKRKSRLLV